MDLGAVLDGLADALTEIEGLKVYPYPITSPELDAAVITPEVVPFDLTMKRGGDRATFTVRVLTGGSIDRVSTQRLLAYVNGSGTRSIKAAIEADKTLGGACESLRVTSAQQFGVYAYDNNRQLPGCELTIEVVGTGP